MTNTPETLNILTPDFRMPEHCGGDRWSILHGDSLQILRQFVPNSFDAIITDPPYASGGSSQTTKNRSTNEKYSSMSKEKALPDFDSDQMDFLAKRHLFVCPCHHAFPRYFLLHHRAEHGTAKGYVQG